MSKWDIYWVDGVPRWVDEYRGGSEDYNWCWFVRRFAESKVVYGTMYGGKPKEGNGIIEIETDGCVVDILHARVVYRWGGPGLDVAVFNFSDYGKTWGFRAEEIKEEQ